MREILSTIVYKRQISAIITIAIFCWLAGFPFSPRPLEAEKLAYVSDTLSNSIPDTLANHTFVFNTHTGIAAGETIRLSLVSFDLGSVDYTDIDFADDGVDLELAADPLGATWGVSKSGTDIIISSGTGVIAADSTTTIQIGTNASHGLPGTHQIKNPVAPGSYVVSVAGTQVDNAETRVNIVPPVIISAEVATILEFNVTGVTQGETVNGEALTTVSATTPTLLPFGLLTPETPVVLAQDLSVTSNATNGFSVTITAENEIMSSNGSKVHSFVDGLNTAVPTAWVPPSANGDDIKTFGHEGVTSDDADQAGGEWNGTKYARNFIGTPRQVFSHTKPSNGLTQNKGKARVGFKIETSFLQPSGNDYFQRLWYTCTPSF